jgi:gamma-glutamylcyclotransferase (GGCT)/AIG2-like uncharacterized protein YtfP
MIALYLSKNQSLSPMNVFVYGTLKPGEFNYPRYCEGKVLTYQDAIAYGQLYHLQARGYPAMMTGEGTVYGVLLTFRDTKPLSNLDYLEDYLPDRAPEENEYQRQEIEIFDLDFQSLGYAWAYLMLPDRVQSLGGIPLPKGVWPGE